MKPHPETPPKGRVVGVFDDPAAAERAIQLLRERGFSDRDLAYVRLAAALEADSQDLAGAAAGGLLGAVAGLAAAVVLVPGLGQVLLAGALLGASLGAGAGTALEEIARTVAESGELAAYEDELKQGKVLVMVGARGRRRAAVDALRMAGGRLKERPARAE